MSRVAVVGVGGAILDQLLHVSEAYVRDHVPGKKGGMEPVSFEVQEALIEGSGGKPHVALGGSARNTMQGLSRFGEKTAFFGMVGSDARGKLYRELLEREGVVPILLESETHTGTVLSLVTPDGERTMRTFQGASVEVRGDHLPEGLFDGVRLVHLEGYTLFNPGYPEAVMARAKAVGAKVSFDMASFEIVHAFRDRILDLLRYVDIIFCNEEEVGALGKGCEETTCDFLSTQCEVSVVLMGPEGCWVRSGSEKVRCSAYPVKPLDTTGAGDLFASGFLHGYLQNCSLEVSAHYGAIAGRAVVQEVGAAIPHDKWPQIFAQLKR